MKKILVAVLCLSIATPTLLAKEKDEEYKVVVIKSESSGYVYENVVNVEGVSKEEMFKRAKTWIIANLKTEDNNINFDEAGMSITNTATLVLKAASGFNWAITHGVVNFKLNIMFKEGRYKFIFDNIVVQAAYADGIVETLNYDQLQRNNKPAKHIRKEVNEKLLAVSSQLEAAIKSGGKANDNW